MRNFVFYDSDPGGHVERDVSGQQYEDLLKSIFEYAYSFSVILSPYFKDDIAHWDKYRIKPRAEVFEVYSHYGIPKPQAADKIGDYEIRYYRLCPELCEMILDRTDSVFKWLCGWGYNNPDDPCFYRADGTLIFSSIIHEGECSLVLKETEYCPVI